MVTFIKNVLLVVLLSTAVAAFVGVQRDRAASRPAGEDQITRYRVDYALKKAKARHKFLMIEFGAGWCEDCIVLARNLEDPSVRDYFQKTFDLLFVDVGHSDRNFAAADALGVDLNHGIPAAVFFDPDGKRIGATNSGELESARNYMPQQILPFLRSVADHHALTPIR